MSIFTQWKTVKDELCNIINSNLKMLHFVQSASKLISEIVDTSNALCKVKHQP